MVRADTYLEKQHLCLDTKQPQNHQLSPRFAEQLAQGPMRPPVNLLLEVLLGNQLEEPCTAVPREGELLASMGSMC